MKKLIIPEGTKVIESRCYANTDYDEVIMPDSVEYISEAAFMGCKKLKKVKLSNNLKCCEEGVFTDCISLESIDIPESLTFIPRLFLAGCINLKKCNIHDGITYIDHFGLYNCKSLEDFSLPPNITYVGINALAKCEKIKKLYIPASLTDIESGAFSYMSSLEMIDVNQANPKYDEIEHLALLDKENGVLLQYAIGSKRDEFKVYHYPIKYENTGISWERFYNLSDYAFAGAKNLKKLYLTAAIESFGPKTFDGMSCPYLKILIDDYSENLIMSPAPIHGKVFSPFKEVEIEEGIKAIASNASGLFNNARQIKLPKTLETIGTKVFINAKNLKELFLPNSLKQIFVNTFHKNTKLIFEDFLECMSDEFVMLQTKLNENLQYSSLHTEMDLTRIFSFKDGTYYVRFDEYDFIKITKDEITTFAGKTDVLEDQPEVFLSFFNKLYYCYTSFTDEFYRFIKDDDINKSFTEFFKEYDTVEALSNIILRKLIDRIIENDNRKKEFLLNGFLIQNISKGNLLILLENLNPALERFLKETHYFEQYNKPHVFDNYYNVSKITNYCNLLNKYNIKDSYLYSIELAVTLEKDEQELLLSHFNANIKILMKKIDSLRDVTRVKDMIKILRSFGVFSDDPIFSQKITTFLIEKVFNEEDEEYGIYGDDIHRVFNEFNPSIEIKYDFIKFFLFNYKGLVDQECISPGFMAKVYNNFEDIQKFCSSDRGSCRKLMVTIDKCLYYFVYKTFTNVNENNKELAIFLGKFYFENGVLTKAEELLEEAKKAPRNIFTISDSPDDDLIGEETNGYKYEWLNKQSWDNLILGKLCNCCAHICGNGAGIMYASMIKPNFQNMVIRDKDENIIGKATIYVDRMCGTALFNTIEISYQHTNDDAKRKIYKVFKDGVNAFIETYNKNNSIPIRRVNIGTNQNQLLDFLNVDCKEATDKTSLPQYDYSTHAYVIDGKPHGTHQGDALKQLILK